MQRLGMILAILAISGVFIGCGPEKLPQPVSDSVLSEANLQYYWDAELPLLKDETPMRLQLLDENLYILTDLNRLHAVDAATGVYKWGVEVAQPGRTVFRPTHADEAYLADDPLSVAHIAGYKELPSADPADIVTINSVDRLLVIHRDDGEIIRDIDLPFSANSGGACDGRYYYVGSTNGRFYAYALNEAVKVWDFKTENMISAPLALHSGNLYVASEDESLYCSSTGYDGDIAWSQGMGGPCTTAMYIDDHGCFVPNQDYRLYAFDAVVGKRLWTFICEGPLATPVQASENTLFQYAQNDAFYAIDISNGEMRWREESARRVLAVMDGNVYVITADGSLHVVDEMDGKQQAAFPMTGMELFAGNTTADAIYSASSTGKLFCIRHQEAGRITVEDLKN